MYLWRNPGSHVVDPPYPDIYQHRLFYTYLKRIDNYLKNLEIKIVLNSNGLFYTYLKRIDNYLKNLEIKIVLNSNG